MKKLVYGMSLAAMLSFSSVQAHASGGGSFWSFWAWFTNWISQLYSQHHEPQQQGGTNTTPLPSPTTPGTNTVPEMDGSSAGLALALLAGFALIARERRNARK